MSHSTAIGPMTGVQPAKSGVARIVRFLDQNFVWVLLVLLMVLGRVSHPLFLSPQNLTNILYSSAPLGCLLLAQALVLISGNFDLSTEANMIFSAVLAGYFMQAPEAGGAGWPWPAALVAMLAAATGVGLVNGLLVVKLRMNAFMTTLAMLVALGGMSLAITRGRGQPLVPEGFRWAGFENIGPIPVAVIFLLLLYLIAHVVLTRTVFGAHVYAVGGNRRAARTAGINHERIVMTAFITAGLLCGLAAFLLVGRFGTATTSLSTGALFITIAGAVVGGVSLFGGRGKASGMLGGLLLMVSITNAINISNIESEWVSIVTGAIIIVAVFGDSLRARRRMAE